MRLFIIISILSLLFYKDSNAQNTNQGRPKVGLVLSGGGAKGFAHVGVIKAMEEAGLYPDYITGTSMGSIIGGLYAMGYSADEIKEIGLSIDWDKVLSNEISLDKVAIEEKDYYDRFIIELPFRNKKIGLPQGLIEGQELGLLLSKLMRPAHHIHDFDSLSIPFKCIAVDIENGEAHVLDSGSIVQSVRASMAIPTFFTPVLMNNTLYIDGGLLRNFPVDEVKEMGADIVIGVFVSNELSEKEDLNSMVNLLAQSAFVHSALDSEEQKKGVDIYIEPDISEYSTASFWSTDKIIASGELAGQENLNKFKQLADSLNKFGPPTIPKKLQAIDTYKFKKIIVKGNVEISDELILSKLRIKENEPIEIPELEKRLDLIYGTRYFSKVYYTIDEPNESLIVNVRETSKTHLKFAAHYDSDNKAGIVLNLTSRNFIVPNSRIVAEYDLAQYPRFDLNYLKYIGGNQNIAALANFTWMDYETSSYWDISDSTDVGSKEGLTSLLNNSVINPYLGVQTTFASNMTIGSKVQYLSQFYTSIVSDSVVSNNNSYAFRKAKFKDWSVNAFYSFNNTDRQFFPNKGLIMNIQLDYLFGRSNYIHFTSNQLGNLEATHYSPDLWLSDFSILGIIPIIERLAMIAQFQLTISNQDASIENSSHQTRIGGNRPMGWSVYSYDAVGADRFEVLNFSAIALQLRWEFKKDFFLTGKLDYLESEYPMKLFNSNYISENFDAYARRLGVGLRISYKSIVGPIEIGIAKDQYFKDAHVYFGFGYYLKNQ